MTCRAGIRCTQEAILALSLFIKRSDRNCPIVLAFLTLCVSIGHLHSPAAIQIDQSTIHSFTHFHIFKCSLQVTTQIKIKRSGNAGGARTDTPAKVACAT